MKNIKLTKIWIFILVAIFANNTLAIEPTIVTASIDALTEIKASVNIKKIIIDNTSEKHGDELYFSITQYSNKRGTAQFRVPMFPIHWQLKNIEQLKDLNLWQGTLIKDESIQLIISLLEQDVPPLDPDDHIGSVKVTLTNVKGKLQFTWEIANLRDQQEVIRLHRKLALFMLKGHNAQYKISFDVQQIHQ